MGTTAAALRDALTDQLVRKHMAADECHAGCLPITINSDRTWQHPDTGATLELTALIGWLNFEAQEIGPIHAQGLGSLCPIDDDGREAGGAGTKGLRPVRRSPGNEHFVAGCRQPVRDPAAKAAVAAKQQNKAHSARTLSVDRLSGFSGLPTRPLTMAAWMKVAGHSLETGPTSLSRTNGNSRLSD